MLKKSGDKTPRIEINEIRPRSDFSIRRTRIASENVFKLSRRNATQLKIKRTKNLNEDALGNVQGKVHISKQNVEQLQTRRMKGLRRSTKQL